MSHVIPLWREQLESLAEVCYGVARLGPWGTRYRHVWLACTATALLSPRLKARDPGSTAMALDGQGRAQDSSPIWPLCSP